MGGEAAGGRKESQVITAAVPSREVLQLTWLLLLYGYVVDILHYSFFSWRDCILICDRSGTVIPSMSPLPQIVVVTRSFCRGAKQKMFHDYLPWLPPLTLSPKQNEIKDGLHSRCEWDVGNNTLFLYIYR